MKSIEIKAASRDHFGKKSSNSLRAENNVPCVMYGGEENLHFYAHENAFRKLVYTPEVYLVSLIIDGKSYNAVMKDLQFHPVSDKLLHIDFIEVSDKKPVTINIPIKITGESAGVKAGGKLRIKRRSLRVRGLAADLPDHLNIDITKLQIGQSIKIGDLSYDKLEITDNKRAMVAAVAVSRVSLKEEGITAEGEEAAGEASTEEQGEAAEE
ncbi:MAG: 50S ribosomal protein L25/general stress protein Ctc [Bacteroidales bacterium]|nr:50S ribosomal protein L25/general stress protein Ctc [Bacteroidales bacterium]MDT8374028.1 50S ribosomal protein L25/general stress protein Ctc [Bacteroidales bacterium]